MDLNNTFEKDLEDFKSLISKLLKHEVSEDNFQQIATSYNVSLQRDHSHFILTLDVPVGTLSLEECHFLYDLCTKHNIPTFTFTTTQTISFTELSPETLADIMLTCYQKALYLGNYRPVSLLVSPLSGTTLEESFDVTPYALTTYNYFKALKASTKNSLKVAFINLETEVCYLDLCDIGFIATVKDEKPYFKVYLNNPYNEKTFLVDTLITPDKVIPYIETLLNLEDFNTDTRDLVALANTLISTTKNSTTTYTLASPVDFCDFETPTHLKHNRLFKQVQDNNYTVYFHPIAGEIKLETFKTLVDIIADLNSPIIRLGFTRGLYVLNLDGHEANTFLIHTQGLGGESVFEQSVACLGVPTCKSAILNSQAVLQHLITYFNSHHVKSTYLPKLNFLGCNTCRHCNEIGQMYLLGQKGEIDGKTKDIFKIFFYTESSYPNAVELGTFLKEDITPMLYRLHQILTHHKASLSLALSHHKDEVEEVLSHYSV